MTHCMFSSLLLRAPILLYLGKIEVGRKMERAVRVVSRFVRKIGEAAIHVEDAILSLPSFKDFGYKCKRQKRNVTNSTMEMNKQTTKIVLFRWKNTYQCFNIYFTKTCKTREEGH